MSDKEILMAVTSVVALMLAIIGHEIMHGWVAYKYGDNTAKDVGRLSINPIVHIDLVGSILVPAMLFIAHAPFLFGWAKPVPIAMHTVIRNGGYWAAMQVSLAGIAYNLVTAVLASIVFLSLDTPLVTDTTAVFIYLLLYKLVFINIVLAVFNAWPLPQFDGANFVSYLGLQMKNAKIAQFYDKIGHYGMFIVIAILMFEPLREVLFAPALILKDLLLH